MSESNKSRIGTSGAITVRGHLKEAQRRISEGKRDIAEQRGRLHELRRRGLDTTKQSEPSLHWSTK
jgi:hypothetical protein